MQLAITIKYLSSEEGGADGEYVVEADGQPLEDCGVLEVPDALQLWQTLDGRTFGVIFPGPKAEPLVLEILSGLQALRDAQAQPGREET